MKIKRKIFTNKKTNQWSITIPRKQIEKLLNNGKIKNVKNPKSIKLNLKDIEW